MKISVRTASLFLLAATLCSALIAQTSEKKSAAKPAKATKGAYYTGKYRNLFKEAGYSQKDIDAKINAAFQQLFHGQKEDQPVYYEAGKNDNGPLAYLTDYRNHDVRSEGMSYGMMICVQMNKKAEFDALWNWAKTYMYHSKPTEPGYKFFSWSMNTDGTARDHSPAPDGEEYWTMALYFAANRWGSGQGIYNYKAEADQLLDAMKNREVITGPVLRGRQETDGAEFNPQYKMVRFTPNTQRGDSTDPSYHLPAFYELWALWGPEKDRQFWKDAAQASRDFFQKTTNPTTGLAPNYANFDGTPGGFGGRGSPFADDAWRTEANWSVDWSWWRADPREQQLSDKIQAFFAAKDDNYSTRYSLDGVPQGNPSHDIALVATNAVAGLAATDPAREKKFIDALWKAPVPEGLWRYYDGMWYIMGFLHCSGEFRIWMPKK
ncbi:MAG TPA: glycosyl hydrolase family 8 [Bryobacteraceae bacterium]|nr:glycosyl hydrolase family 8 [Bryobacteraceae bacterium]